MYRERKRIVRANAASKPQHAAAQLNPFKPNSKKLKQGFRFVGGGKVLHVATNQVVVIPEN